MNRGWIVGGALVLVAVPAVPAAAGAGVTMALDRVDGSAGPGDAGDVLRYRVRFDGTARQARLAVAATPVHALTSLTCSPPPRLKQPADATPPVSAPTTVTPDASQERLSGEVPLAVSPGSAAAAESGASFEASAGLGADAVDGVSAAGVLAARTLADMEALGSSEASVPGARACALGGLSGKKAVDVVLTVPEGAGEVALVAVARMRQDGSGLTTLSEATRIPVRAAEPDSAVAFSGPALRVEPRAKADRPQTVRRRPAETLGRTRRQAESPRTPQVSPQGGTPGRARATRQGGTSGMPQVGPRGGIPGMPQVAPQGGIPGTAQVGPRGGTSGTARAARRGGTPGAAEMTRQTGMAEAARRSGVGVARDGGAEGVGQSGEMGPAADLMRGPALRTAPEGMKQEEARLPVAAVPGPSVSGVSMDVPGAPLPRALPAPQVRLQAAEVANPLAGAQGLPVVAGGIAVLMAGLWGIGRAHRRRTRRKVL